MIASLSAEVALHWTVGLASFGVVLQCVAGLYSHREWGVDGLRSWPIISTRWPWMKRRRRLASILTLLFNPPGILIIIALRLIAATLLVLLPLPSGSSIVAILWICISNILLRIRTHIVSGDQTFAQLIFLTVLLSVTAGHSHRAQVACLWFIALQASLAYFTNGFRKWQHPVWREGKALTALTAHPILGWEPAHTWLKAHPTFGRLLTYSAMVCLVSMPLVFITGPIGLTVGLSWALSFHLINAVLFRLGSYFWTFSAAFPAIIFCNTMVGNLWD